MAGKEFDDVMTRSKEPRRIRGNSVQRSDQSAAFTHEEVAFRNCNIEAEGLENVS